MNTPSPSWCDLIRFAYNTNGLQSHRLGDALSLLADAGWDGVALTLDTMHLDPLESTEGEARDVARRLADLGLAVTVETGARYVLDRARKHWPSLVSRDPLGRERRLDHLRRCIDLAALLEAEAVTLFSGAPEDGLGEDAWGFLTDGLWDLMGYAGEREVELSMEPEPGHLVERLSDYDRLRRAVAESGELALTLDVGHIPVSEPELGVPEAIRAYGAHVAVVHLEDAPPGVHEHLPFGEGALDIPEILATLDDVGFRGLAAVELSRHSHAAHELVFASLEYLREASSRS